MFSYLRCSYRLLSPHEEFEERLGHGINVNIYDTTVARGKILEMKLNITYRFQYTMAENSRARSKAGVTEVLGVLSVTLYY